MHLEKLLFLIMCNVYISIVNSKPKFKMAAHKPDIVLIIQNVHRKLEQLRHTCNNFVNIARWVL